MRRSAPCVVCLARLRDGNQQILRSNDGKPLKLVRTDGRHETPGQLREEVLTGQSHIMRRSDPHQVRLPGVMHLAGESFHVAAGHVEGVEEGLGLLEDLLEHVMGVAPLAGGLGVPLHLDRLSPHAPSVRNLADDSALGCHDRVLSVFQ